jgi:hypothetical protein
MTEHKFPEAQPIDADALDDGDRVLIEAVTDAAPTIRLKGTDVVLSAYLHNLYGHVIKAPKPIAVGDTVSIVGRVPGHWVVLALDDDVAWLRHTENPTRFRRESVLLAALVRAEP